MERTIFTVCRFPVIFYMALTSSSPQYRYRSLTFLNFDFLFPAPQPANDLVKRLMKEQPVELIRYKDADKLKKAAENGYVLVKFTGTQGGTELGANVKNDDPKCQVTFNEQEKTATIHGRLKLDFTPVHLIATINLDTFQGQGHLMVVDDWPRAK